MIKRRKLQALLVVVAGIVAAVRPVTAEPDAAHQIGAKLKCMCGTCDQSAGGCSHTGADFSGPCGAAQGMLKEITTRLGQGESETQILAAFGQQYGLAVFLEPP